MENLADQGDLRRGDTAPAQPSELRPTDAGARRAKLKPMRGLGTHFLLPFGLLAAIFSIFVVYRTCSDHRRHARELLTQQAELITEYNLAIRDYAARKIRPVMEPIMGRDGFNPETMSTSFISRSIFEAVRKKFPDCIIRFASDDPRNPVNKAGPDELRMIEYFRKNPQAGQKIEEIDIGGRRFMAFFVPKFVTQDCMRCHGDPKDAPAALVKRYGNTGSFHRAVGDVAGLDMVAVPLDKLNAAASAGMWRQAIVLVAGFAILVGLVMLVFRLMVTRRLTAMARHFHDLAARARSPWMTPVEIGRQDEIGLVARAFNGLLERLRSAHALLEERVSQRTEELSRANDELRREIVERKRAEDDLRTAARIDRLTGLSNRNLLLDRLSQAILRAQRTAGYRFAILYIDLDGFKLINDSMGHQQGDLLLAEAARRLREDVRAIDTVSAQLTGNTAARLGGDEFIILLDGIASDADAQLVAGRVLKVLSQPYVLQGHEVVCTASIGIVTSQVAGQDTEDMIRDADTALYEAKQAGRARHVVFDASMRTRVQARLGLENDLRKALEAKQLQLFYQPIISLETGRIDGFEALLRWRHPERGMVSPAEFIPVAEESGLILPIGEWVVREACRQLAEWRSTGAFGIVPPISVNLSRHQLVLSDLPARLSAILEETGVEPSDLHLEITESAVMRDPQTATGVLRQLKRLGFRIDLDDFGTGYSSLACLHQFPIDAVKIDRSFVANMEKGQDFVQFVNAIIMLAGSFRMAVVAEGVETQGQLALLQSLNCQYAQGYFFAKPMPPAQAIAFSAEGRIPGTTLAA
ncbi:MAG: EAL domain-containing protein [Tepidisphaerales bacterium]